MINKKNGKSFISQTRIFDKNGKNNLKNMKHFHWDIITICNYHCEYCYSRDNDTQWNKITNKIDIDIILTELEKVIHPTEILLLGGEPTKHPHYFYILDRLLSFNDNLIMFGIISNGAYKDVNKFIDNHLKYKEKFVFHITYHPSEVKDIEEFFRTIIQIKELGFQLEVNILLNENYMKKITEVLYFCKDNLINYRPSLLFDGDDFVETSDEFKQWLQEINLIFNPFKEMIFYDGESEVRLNDIDTYLQEYKSFTGWNCNQNTYYIPVAGNKIIRFCKEDEVNAEYINDPINDYIICPLKFCICPGKTTDEKFRNIIK